MKIIMEYEVNYGEENDEEKLISKMKRGSEILGREFFRCIAVSDGFFFLILSQKSKPRSSF